MPQTLCIGVPPIRKARKQKNSYNLLVSLAHSDIVNLIDA